MHRASDQGEARNAAHAQLPGRAQQRQPGRSIPQAPLHHSLPVAGTHCGETLFLKIIVFIVCHTFQMMCLYCKSYSSL